MGTTPGLSAALQAANERLFALRQQQQVGKGTVSQETMERPTAVFSPSTAAQDAINQLPPHLGWGSVPLTAVSRQPSPSVAEQPANPTTNVSQAAAETPQTAVSLKLYPDIARAMLQQDLANPGRLWLVLRHLDENQQGWLRIVDAKEQLTRKTAVFQLCGWRQLRNLLRAGNGIFWQRDKERVWLYGVRNVAQRLQISRLSGFPIQLPLRHLFEGIGVFRAHLYASIHSGRRRAKPISREKISQLSGITPRTQRLYDRIAKVQRIQNIAVGEKATDVSWETMSWERGRGVFPLKDVKGRFGKPNETYLAWQLPNQYIGPHKPCPKGRQKKINQKLADLVHSGMRGNGRSDENLSQPRLYFEQAGTAVRHLQQEATSSQTHVYWPEAKNGRSTQLWHALAR